MRVEHQSDAKIAQGAAGCWSYDGAAMHDDKGAVTRTLTIVLPEPEWRALREAEPDAIGWLQERIRERLAGPPAPARAERSARPDHWLKQDEY
jgi:hypothetical protein